MGVPREIDGEGYQPGTQEGSGVDGYSPGSGVYPSGSGGDQAGSDDPAVSPEVPHAPSRVGEDEGRMDPYEAFAEIERKVREEKEQEAAGADEILRPPGARELDNQPIREETGFSGDTWGGRGNPQVGVRLRPLDFQRLRQAAEMYGVRPTTLARMMVIRGVRAILDGELQRKADRLRERGY